jgi:hypothetical protein
MNYSQTYVINKAKALCACPYERDPMEDFSHVSGNYMHWLWVEIRSEGEVYEALRVLADIIEDMPKETVSDWVLINAIEYVKFRKPKPTPRRHWKFAFMDWMFKGSMWPRYPPHKDSLESIIYHSGKSDPKSKSLIATLWELYQD